MFSTPTLYRRSAPVLALAGLLGLAGCSTNSAPTFYEPARESTSTDAQHQAQGRGNAQAPSQLQFGFGETGTETAAADTAPESTTAPRQLREPKTFLGTVPCLSGAANCPAQRITLTLAPGGEWRARTEYLGADATVPKRVEQGCWNVTGTQPLRIQLETSAKVGKAVLSFTNDHMLRVILLNDVAPTLDAHLTRQADIDPIAEIQGPAITCRPVS